MRVFGMFLILACGVGALPTAAFGEVRMAIAGPAIAGGWTLESVQDGPRIARDPRWGFTLEFDASGVFAATSTVTLEKQQSGAPPGAAVERTQGVTVPVALRGTYRLVGTTLILSITPPPAGAERQLALANFGAPAPDGTFRPQVAVEGGLTITNPTSGRVLRFQRRTRV